MEVAARAGREPCRMATAAAAIETNAMGIATSGKTMAGMNGNRRYATGDKTPGNRAPIIPTNNVSGIKVEVVTTSTLNAER